MTEKTGFRILRTQAVMERTGLGFEGNKMCEWDWMQQRGYEEKDWIRGLKEILCDADDWIQDRIM